MPTLDDMFPAEAAQGRPETPAQGPAPAANQIDSLIVKPAVESRGFVKDAAVGAVAGVEQAGRGAVELAAHVGKQLVPPFLRDSVPDVSLPAPMAPQPETLIGSITKDVTRLGLGFAATGPGVGLAGFAVKSAVATAVTNDPNQERLSDFIQKYPALQNPLSEYLSSKADDSVATARLKSTLEDLGLSAVGGVIAQTFKAAKSMFPAAAKAAPVAGKVGETASETASTVKPLVATKVGETASEAEPILSKEAAQASTSADAVGLKLTPADSEAIAEHMKANSLADEFKVSELADGPGSLLNLRKLNTGNDTKSTLNVVGDIVGKRMEAMGWKPTQTHRETLTLAEQLGESPDELVGKLHLAGVEADKLPQTIVAGRMLIESHATDFFSSVRKAAVSGEGMDEALSKMHGLADILASTKMATTGAARATEAGRMAVSGAEINPDRLANWLANAGSKEKMIAEILSTDGDATALAKLVRSNLDKTDDVITAGMRTHNTYWINSLLSSPATHIVNAVSNATNMLVQPLNLLPGAVVRRDWDQVVEAGAMYSGMLRGLKDSFSASWKAFKSEQSVLGGARTVEDTAKLAPIETSKALWAQTLRFPTRLLGASDEFFQQMNYRSFITGNATREAYAQVKAGTLHADQLDTFVAEKLNAAFDKTGLALREDAKAFAEKSTFVGDLNVPTWTAFGNVGGSISNLAASHPIIRGTVLPFIKVPVNIMRQVADYTPVIGQLQKRFYTAIQAGGRERDEALGKLALGTGYWTLAGSLALNGRITSSAPRDPELRAAKLATGWQPNSLVFNNEDGTKTYLSINRLAPFSIPLTLAADFVNITGHLDDKTRDNWAVAASLSIANSYMNTSFMQASSELMHVMASENQHQALKYMQGKLASYIPGLIKVGQSDVEQKELRGMLDKMAAKVPGWSATLEPKRDIFGEKQLPSNGLPVAGINYSAANPFTVSTEKSDPVIREMARLSDSESKAQWTQANERVGNIDLTQFKKPSGQTAYDRLTELAGVGLKAALADRMSRPSYVHGSDGDVFSQGSRASMLKEVVLRYRAKALQQVQQEYPQLKAAMRADKGYKAAVSHGATPRAGSLETLQHYGDN